MPLVARDLAYAYGEGTPFRTQALDGVDLTVEPGELLVVAGTTGSGKSTLLRLLAGLLEPQAGTAEVEGRPVGAKSSRGSVALVFQNPESQFFAETLLADVAFGPRNLGLAEPRERASAALAAVGLDPETFGPRSPFTLSGGEARRAAIAGALAMDTPYLLLDEPTAGLDACGRGDVLAAIAAHRARAGVVVVTHDPEEFLVVATGVLALEGGRQVFSGSVGELLETPGSFEAAGLRLPAVVQVQRLARLRGCTIPRLELDPAKAAASLLESRAGSR